MGSSPSTTQSDRKPKLAEPGTLTTKVVSRFHYSFKEQVRWVLRFWLRSLLGSSQVHRYGFFVESSMHRMVLAFIAQAYPKLSNKLTQLDLHLETVSLAISEDGRRLFTGADSHIECWDLFELRREQTIPIPNGFDIAACLACRRGQLACGGVGCNDISLFDVDSLGWLWTFEDHETSVKSVDFNHSGSLLVSASSDSTIRLWSVQEPRQQLRVFVGHHGWVYNAQFLGHEIVSCGSDQSIRVWNLNRDTYEREITKGTPEVLRRIVVNCERNLAVALSVGWITVFQWPEMKVISQIEHSASLVSFHPSISDYLAVKSIDKAQITVLNVLDQTEVEWVTMEDDKERIMDLQWTPDGTRLLWAKVKELYVWDLCSLFDE